MPRKSSKPLPKPSPAQEVLLAEMRELMRRQLEAHLPGDTATLDEIETAAGIIGGKLTDELRRRLIEEHVKPE